MLHKIATNHEIAPLVLDLIGRADKQIDIISPYIKRWGNLDRQIDSAAKKEVIINVIFREEKKSEYSDITTWLHRLGVHLFTVKDLHSKVYSSEKDCILTSMNLYDYSAANSEEVALFSADGDLLESVHKYVAELKSRATPLNVEKVGKVFNATLKPSQAAGSPQLAGSAYCIRCQSNLKFNIERPLCYECFTQWNKYKNPEYQEKFCHRCGKPGPATLAKPLCSTCTSAAR